MGFPRRIMPLSGKKSKPDELDIYAHASASSLPETQQQADATEFVNIAKALYAQDGINEYSDSEVEKWFISCGRHRGKALEAIANTLIWRKSFDTENLFKSDFSDLEQLGKIFFAGKALDGSAVCWWIGSKHESPKDNAAKEREVRYIVYILERARREGILTDKMTIIFDRTGMKADKADLAFAKHILPIFQKHYPEKVFRVYIFPKNTFLSMVFKMFSMLLRPETVNRIVLRSGPECLVEGLSRENILKRFGGTLESPFAAKYEDESTAFVASEESEVVLDGVEAEPEGISVVASPAKGIQSETRIFSDEDEEEIDEFTDADAEIEHQMDDLNQSVIHSKTSSALPPLPTADCAMVIEEVWSAPEDISE